MDEFTEAYITCALWSSNDDGERPLDANYTAADIAAETLSQMIQDCKSFQDAHAADIAADIEGAGHDLWLTRSYSGAGYWDGDWPEPAASRLTDAAHQIGQFTLYIGDDGLVHGCRG